mgnify:CR=1 FL=1
MSRAHWRFWGKRKSAWLTPEAIETNMPKDLRSAIVRFGENDHQARFYWQLRRHDSVKDLAIRAFKVTQRQQALPLSAQAVQEFLQVVDTDQLIALYLVQVPASLIDAGVLAQLAANSAMPATKIVDLVIPAPVMYDFLANEASDDRQVPVTVGELLDGWPMKSSQTLGAFLQNARAVAHQIPAPLPSVRQVQLSDWQQADATITKLFDLPLRQAMATEKNATFVFTDME